MTIQRRPRASRRSSCPPGRSATPAPGSRCSRSRASRATRTRRSPTPRRCTGTRASAPRVSLHIPWDLVDDYDDLARARRGARACPSGRSTRTCSRTTTTCSGSLTHPSASVRAKAVAHHLQCIDVMRATGSTDLKLWLPDGLNYPGQDSLRARQDRLADSLAEIYAALDPNHRLILEYKFFEPAFYSMDIPDWGTSLLHCLALGDRAFVVLDTGHHAPGTNIEFIVAQLLRAGPPRRVRLQLPVLRRRRPHGRLRGPVPAVPDHARDRAVGSPRAGLGRQLHARPVPQHRAEDPRADPLGHERPGGHGEGAAGRRRRAARGAAGR